MARAYFGGCLILLLLMSPIGAQGQESRSQMFQRAKALYGEGSYREALEFLEMVYKGDPDPALLYNMARCQEKLGEVTKSLELYRQYLENQISADQRARVEEKIKELAAKAPGEIAITSEPAQSQVLIDGEMSGITPCSLEVNPGRHFITVTKDDFSPRVNEVVIRPGQKQVLSFALKEKAGVKSAALGTLVVESNVPGARVFIGGKDKGEAPCTVQAPTSTLAVRVEAPGHGAWEGRADVEAERTVRIQATLKASGRSWMPSALSWTFMATGAAALAAGGITGGLASSQMNDALSQYDNAKVTQDLEGAYRAEEAAGTKALAANILLGAGGAALVTGVLLWVLLPPQAERAPPVSVGLGPKGVMVAGTWE